MALHHLLAVLEARAEVAPDLRAAVPWSSCKSRCYLHFSHPSA